MPRITAIRPQARSESRVNVHLDGSYWVSLDIQQLVDLRVKVGLEIDESTKAAIEQESGFGKAYAAALNYLSIRIRSEKELRDYGFKKRWEPELIERVIDRLTAKGYLNDAAFASRWAQNRQMSKPMSTRRLTMELRQKGISGDQLHAALADFDEAAMLRLIIEKKAARYNSQPDKLKAYLMRQGFSYDAITRALSEADSDREEV